MPITCLLSNTYSDLRCPVCGQGFLIFAKARNLVSRTQLRRKVGELLRAEHVHVGETDVHSTEPFKVTADDCSPLEWMREPLHYPAEALLAAD